MVEQDANSLPLLRVASQFVLPVDEDADLAFSPSPSPSPSPTPLTPPPLPPRRHTQSTQHTTPPHNPTDAVDSSPNLSTPSLIPAQSLPPSLSPQARENLLSLSQASPLTIAHLLSAGQSSLIAEQQFSHIQRRPFLMQYYLQLNRSLSSAVLALAALHSQCVADDRSSFAERATAFAHSLAVSSNVFALPFVTGAVQKLVAMQHDYERGRSIENVTRSFPSLAYHHCIETLCRELAVEQESEINALVRESKESTRGTESERETARQRPLLSALQSLLSAASAAQAQLDFALRGVAPQTAVEALASLHAERVLEGLMFFDAERPAQSDAHKSLARHVLRNVFGVRGTRETHSGDDDSEVERDRERAVLRERFGIHPVTVSRLWVLKGFALDRDLFVCEEEALSLSISPSVSLSLSPSPSLSVPLSPSGPHSPPLSLSNPSPSLTAVSVSLSPKRRPLPSTPSDGSAPSEDALQQLSRRVRAMQQQVSDMELDRRLSLDRRAVPQIESERDSKRGTESSDATQRAHIETADTTTDAVAAQSSLDVQRELDELRGQLTRLSEELRAQRERDRVSDTDCDVDVSLSVGGGAAQQLLLRQQKRASQAQSSSSARERGRENDLQIARIESVVADLAQHVQVLQEDLVSLSVAAAVTSSLSAALPLSYASPSPSPSPSPGSPSAAQSVSRVDDGDVVVETEIQIVETTACCAVQ